MYDSMVSTAAEEAILGKKMIAISKLLIILFLIYTMLISVVFARMFLDYGMNPSS